jgi:hypothetical protein
MFSTGAVMQYSHREVAKEISVGEACPSLPDEIILLILKCLNHKDWITASQICLDFQRVSLKLINERELPSLDAFFNFAKCHSILCMEEAVSKYESKKAALFISNRPVEQLILQDLKFIMELRAQVISVLHENCQFEEIIGSAGLVGLVEGKTLFCLGSEYKSYRKPGYFKHIFELLEASKYIDNALSKDSWCFIECIKIGAILGEIDEADMAIEFADKVIKINLHHHFYSMAMLVHLCREAKGVPELFLKYSDSVSMKQFESLLENIKDVESFIVDMKNSFVACFGEWHADQCVLSLLSPFALVLNMNGQHEAAFDLAQKITIDAAFNEKYNYEKSRTISEICTAVITKNDLDSALRYAAKIPDKGWHAKIVAKVFKSLIRKGAVEKALNEVLPDERKRNTVLMELVSELIEEEDFEKANEVVNLISARTIRSNCLEAICLKLVQLHDFDRARYFADLIPMYRKKAEMFVEIAELASNVRDKL